MVYNNNSLENICAYFGKHRENICHKQTLKKAYPKKSKPFNLLIFSIIFSFQKIDYPSTAACAPLICNSLSILTKFGVCDVYAFFVNWGRLTGKIAFYSSIAACAPPIRI